MQNIDESFISSWNVSLYQNVTDRVLRMNDSERLETWYKGIIILDWYPGQFCI